MRKAVHALMLMLGFATIGYGLPEAPMPLSDQRIRLDERWQRDERSGGWLVAAGGSAGLRLVKPWPGDDLIPPGPMAIELEFCDTLTAPATFLVAPYWTPAPKYIGQFGGTGDGQWKRAVFAVDAELISQYDGMCIAEVVAPTGAGGGALAVRSIGLSPLKAETAEQSHRRRWQTFERSLEQAKATMTCLDRPAAMPQSPPGGGNYIAFNQPADQRLMPFEVPPPDRWGLQPIRLRAAGGQRESASIGLFALAPLKGLTVRVSDLTGPGGTVLSAAAVRIGRTLYLPVARPAPGQSQIPRGQRPAHYATWPHRLLPLDRPLDAPAGQNVQLWLTVAAAAGTAAGDYRGQVTIESAGSKPTSCELTVIVRPFDLDGLARNKFWANAFTPAPVKRDELADMVEHSASAFMIFYSDFQFDMRNEGGRMVIDWSRYNLFIRQLKQAGLAGPLVLVLGNASKGHFERHLGEVFPKELPGLTLENSYIDLANERLNELYVEGLRQFFANAQANEYPEVILLPYDEATIRLIEPFRNRCRLIHKNFPGVKIYGVPMDKLKYAEMIVDDSDILVANGDYPAIRRLCDERGKEMWCYGSGRTTFPDNPLHEVRQTAGYEPWRIGVTGRWWWAYHWTSGEPLDDLRQIKYGETMAGYESHGRPVGCPGWEMARAGLDDVRYLLMLARLADENAALPAAALARTVLADLKSRDDQSAMAQLTEWLRSQGRLVAEASAMDVVREAAATLIEAIQAEKTGAKSALPPLPAPVAARLPLDQPIAVELAEVSGLGTIRLTVQLDERTVFAGELGPHANVRVQVHRPDERGSAALGPGRHRIRCEIHRNGLVGQVGWGRLAVWSGAKPIKQIDCRSVPPLFSHAWLLEAELVPQE